MIKIGILTFHRSINNGAVIQCFSLCEKLKKSFPDCKIEVIDYSMPKVVKEIYPSNLKEYYTGRSCREILSRTIRLIKNPKRLAIQRKKNEAFSNARELLPLSKRFIYSDKTDELFDYINKEYDIVIVGSDAVWNYSMRGFPNPYFLSETVKARKLTYAASCFGLSYEKIPQKEKSVIAKGLNQYDFLGVRDDESQRFAEFCGCTKELVHTCDPTVFLDVEALPIDVKSLEKKLYLSKMDISRETIGVMGDETMCQMVRRMYGDKYQIVSLFNYCKNADVNLFDLNPFEWAYVFRFFKLTFTTYFHGMLLSLKNSTPVIAIALKNEFNEHHVSKVEDFLRRIGMENCYFRINNNFDENMIVRRVNELMNKEFKKEIQLKLEEEAQSLKPFLKEMKNIIEEIEGR